MMSHRQAHSIKMYPNKMRCQKTSTMPTLPVHVSMYVAKNVHVRQAQGCMRKARDIRFGGLLTSKQRWCNSLSVGPGWISLLKKKRWMSVVEVMLNDEEK